MDPSTLEENLLFTTVRIETTNSVGTGFFLDVEDGDAHMVFLVTNKHVIRGSDKGRYCFTLSKDNKPLLGQTIDVVLEAFELHWFEHPSEDVDVALMPATPLLEELKLRGQEAFIRTIPAGFAPDEAKHGRLNAIEEIVFVGYPNGIYDKVNLLPIVRRGITATHPEINYDGQPIFLIDASVFPGSSGSPVFIINSGGYFNRGGLVLGNRFLFLGIVSGVFFREEHGEIIQVPIAEMTAQLLRTREMIHLGVVYKASVVIETAKLYFAHWRGLVSAANKSS